MHVPSIGDRTPILSPAASHADAGQPTCDPGFFTQTKGQHAEKSNRVRRIETDCTSGEERSRSEATRIGSRSVATRIDTSELVSQTVTLRSHNVMLPANMGAFARCHPTSISPPFSLSCSEPCCPAAAGEPTWNPVFFTIIIRVASFPPFGVVVWEFLCSQGDLIVGTC